MFHAFLCFIYKIWIWIFEKDFICQKLAVDIYISKKDKIGLII